jgi:hypothetical protein
VEEGTTEELEDVVDTTVLVEELKTLLLLESIEDVLESTLDEVEERVVDTVGEAIIVVSTDQ